MLLRKCYRNCFLLLLPLMAPLSLSATHQRAAEILYKHLSGLTYEITLISYTYTPSPANAYRDYLTIDWGDGTFSEIPRVEKTPLAGDITFNRYVGQHIFPGPATYTISCEDPNRNGGILNIPNSINTPLFIYSELTINPFLGGYNNSPELLIPPIDNGCVNQPFYHNPGAWDADGDSLSYRLVPCRGAQGLEIPGYTYPQASHSLSLDPVSGDFIWDSPVQQGEYNIAILIEEWRNGIKIGSVLRDMQIIVVACNNHPPVIDPIGDTCVEATKNLRFPIHTYDPDSNNITLTATGGPLILTHDSAFMVPNPATGHGEVQAVFRWSPVCNQVRNHPYQVFFKAKDDASPVNLITIRSILVKVNGPAPDNLHATPLGNAITLNWDPYQCSNANGFSLYRKADSTGYLPGSCETGVPSRLGYTKIATIDDIATTTWLDDNQGEGLIRGVRYCYLLVARYPDGAESYASNETCAALKKDVAIITNVSIQSTSETEGSVFVAWSKPTEIDTLQAPGPYLYTVNRARSDHPGQFATIDSLYSLNDTLWSDNNLNTSNFSYRYRIDLYNLTAGNRFLIGSSQPASSLFLTLTPTDKTLRLQWTNNVPWNNDRFVIYRKDPGQTGFDSIGTSTEPSYRDRGLINGMTYCYSIKSIGKYSAGGFVDPIINDSQEACGIPVDNLPPCPPLLAVTTDCETSSNTLIWTLPADTCQKDIFRYYIYYSPTPGSMILIDSTLHYYDTVYLHRPPQSVVGCYAISAIDSVGNRSPLGNTVCIDNTVCSAYNLPNIFSPNGDGFNDLFRPFPFTSVAEINLTIFDRWGKVVFQTHEPEINWDGKDKTTNQPCSDGTYFFVCEVTEITLSGAVQRTISGSVTILR